MPWKIFQLFLFKRLGKNSKYSISAPMIKVINFEKFKKKLFRSLDFEFFLTKDSSYRQMLTMTAQSTWTSDSELGRGLLNPTTS